MDTSLTLSADSPSSYLSLLQKKYHYGHELLENDTFLLKPKNLINFNHGSFGTVPKPVMESHIAYLYEQEECPEIWFRQSYEPYLNKSREAVASLIKASSVNDVVMVENASSAINGILRSFSFEQDDIILVFSSAYQMVKEVLNFQSNYQKVKMIEIPLLYPIESKEELITRFKEIIGQYQEKVKLCVFSHISSMVSILCYPFSHSIIPSFSSFSS
jgi:selenocysteine lyase/cysteine desulfurase